MKVGVVIIGRNEGSRLDTCLASIRKSVEGPVPFDIADVVYVDSNSTDNSVDLARSHHARVVALDPALPFTAARARNAGAELLLKLHPDLDLLQFADGDTELNPKWLAHAVEYLHHHKHVAVVCGRRRERFPEASVYNLMADMEWDTAIGPAHEFGGDALIRAATFLHHAGYTASFIAGEEPDFAARLRLAGQKIVRLNHEMTLHDLAMTRFKQWWRRMVRSGHALAELAHTHGKAPLYFYRSQRRSTLLWGFVIPLVLLVMGCVVSPWLFVLLPLAYAYLTFRVFRYRLRHGDDHDAAITYALFTAIGKFPQLWGLFTFYRNRIARRPTRLIEYKTAEPLASSHPPSTAVGSN